MKLKKENLHHTKSNENRNEIVFLSTHLTDIFGEDGGCYQM